MRALFLIAWGVLAALLLWRAYDVKAPQIEQDILSRSIEAVRASNPRAEIAVDGRFVSVRGLEPDEATKAKTLAAAGVWGALGPYDGLSVANTSGSQIVFAEKTADGSLGLTGSVPNDAASAAVEAAAKASFTGTIDNNLTNARVDGEPAIAGLADAIKTLASLDTGSLVATPQRFTLSGVTADPTKAAAALALAQAAPDKWQVFVKGTEGPARLGAFKTPDGGVTASGDVPSDEARTALLDALKGGDPDREIVDRLDIRSTNLPDDWTDRAMLGAKALVGLDWGSLTLEGTKSYLSGMAAPGQAGEISDALGSGFTAELTPRPADPDSTRIAALERDLDGARARIRDLSAAAAKHIADLDVAQARLSALQGEADTEKADLEAASKRIAELETAAEKNKADLDAANSRIAGLIEVLTLKPADPALPTIPAPDALLPPAEVATPPANVPAIAAAEPPAEAAPPLAEPAPADGATPPAEVAAPPVATAPPEVTVPPAGVATSPDAAATPPTEPPGPPAAPAPSEQAAMPPVAEPAQPQPLPPIPPAPSSGAEQVANACNSSIGAILKDASITFESKSAQITPEGNAVLDRLVAEAAPCIGNPALRVTVGGHTDSRGQDRDNLRLSKERADSVKESLIVRSVPPDAITAIGYGETLPVADNSTEEGQAANRRITVDWSLR